MSDKRLQEDLVSLTEYAVDAQGRPLKLPPAKVKASLPAVAAIATKNNDQQIPATGGGIASPLTETDITTRTYHAGYYTDTAGLIFMPALATIDFTDANDAAVQLVFDEPV